MISGHVQPRQGTAICNFGGPSPLDFFEFSPVDFFPFSPGLMCKLVRKSPENVEKIAPDFQAEKKAQNPVTSVAVMVFGVPSKGGISESCKGG